MDSTSKEINHIFTEFRQINGILIKTVFLYPQFCSPFIPYGYNIHN